MKISIKSEDFTEFTDVQLIEAIEVRDDNKNIVGYVVAIPDNLFPENSGAHYVGYTYLKYTASEAFATANDAIAWVIEIAERGSPE